MTELKLTSKHSGSLQPLIEGAISLRAFSEQTEWGAIDNLGKHPTLFFRGPASAGSVGLPLAHHELQMPLGKAIDPFYHKPSAL